MQKTSFLLIISLFLFLIISNLEFSYRSTDDKSVLHTYAYLNYSTDKQKIKEIKHLKFNDHQRDFRHQLRVTNTSNYPLYSYFIFNLEKHLKFSQPFTAFLLVQFVNQLLAWLILIYVILNYISAKQRIAFLTGLFISWGISLSPAKILELLPFQSFDYSAIVAYPRGAALLYFLSFVLLLTNYIKNKNRKKESLLLPGGVLALGFLSHIAGTILFTVIYLLTVPLAKALQIFRNKLPGLKSTIFLPIILTGCLILFYFKLLSPNHLKIVFWLIGTLALNLFYLFTRKCRHDQNSLFFNLLILSGLIILPLKFCQDLFPIQEAWQTSPYFYLLVYEIPVRLGALAQTSFWICAAGLFVPAEYKSLKIERALKILVIANIFFAVFFWHKSLIFYKHYHIAAVKNMHLIQALTDETKIYYSFSKLLSK